MVKLTKFAKCVQILKNSVASKETAGKRIFLMKERSVVEEAIGSVTQVVEGDADF